MTAPSGSSAAERRHAVAWAKEHPFGVEYAEILITDGLVDLPPAGGDTDALVDALDCDLGLSPVTNMMPILRHGLLHRGGPIEMTMAWVAVPALTVHADRQRYVHVSAGPGHHIVRYEASDGSFTADITIDADGVVIDYPGIARQLTAETRRSAPPGQH